MTTAALVCPNCGSDQIGTRERAEIWQPATFTLNAEGVEEDATGRNVLTEWDAYDSDDVGDTETIGFFCRACISTWDGSTVPFVEG